MHTFVSPFPRRGLFLAAILFGALCAHAGAGETKPREGWLDDAVDYVSDAIDEKVDGVIDTVDFLGGDETADSMRDWWDNLGKEEEEEAPSVIRTGRPPAVTLRVEDDELKAGDRLRLRVTVEGGSGNYDVYLALRSPLGDTYCFTPTEGLFPYVRPTALGWPVTDIDDATLLDVPLPEGLPVGPYTIMIAVVWPYGNAARFEDWAAVATVQFRVKNS